MSEILFIIGRIILASYCLTMGVNHFRFRAPITTYAIARRLPLPNLAVAISGVMLLIGGLGILLGVYIEISIVLLVIFFVTSAVGVHHFWTDSDRTVRGWELVNFQKNLALSGALLMLFLVPEPWVFSV